MKAFLFGLSLCKLIAIAAVWLAALICAGCIAEPMAMLAPSQDGFKFEDTPIVPEPQTKPEAQPDTTTEPPATVPDPPIQPGGAAGKVSSGGPVFASTPVPPVIKKAIVFAFGPSWCSACPRAKKESAASGDFDFRWESDESKFPDWVKTAGGYPLFWWPVPGTNNWKSSIGWPGLSAFADAYKKSVSQIALATGEAAHTPLSEVVRVIGLLPKPQIAFADLGCGYDARWCIAAAERWGCKCIGIEIDPGRASAARERVRNLGLDNLITIVDGDAGVVPLSADVGVAYLFPELLARLKPRLESFKVFASYLHQPPGLNCTRDGDTWFYRRQEIRQSPSVAAPQAVWQGAFYSQPLCTSPHCAMCNSIRRQLGRR